MVGDSRPVRRRSSVGNHTTGSHNTGMPPRRSVALLARPVAVSLSTRMLLAENSHCRCPGGQVEYVASLQVADRTGHHRLFGGAIAQVAIELVHDAIEVERVRLLVALGLVGRHAHRVVLVTHRAIGGEAFVLVDIGQLVGVEPLVAMGEHDVVR